MAMDLGSLDLGMDLSGSPADKRVVVAMSGGVDSCVVAGLLAARGYEVIGLTLQLYDHGEAVHRAGACCAGQDIHDARRVAEKLDFPHYVLDYESRFRDAVIDRFVDSYLAGETPVPCVDCNRTVKFRDLLATARDLGAAALATGHYVISKPLHGMKQDGHRALYRAHDPDRDQSYFLYATTQDQLDLLRFPLGNMPKSQTRDLARYFGLTVAEKSDSQDICFVPQGRYTDVIEKLRPEARNPGEIVHLDGRILGQHQGVIDFTVGQRKGLGLAVGDPLYVLRLDAEKAQVIVGPREALATRLIRLRDVNWLGEDDLSALPAEGLPIAVRVRSSRPPQPATLYWRDGQAEVELSAGEMGVSPGQACVFYDGDADQARVLGGGTITRKALDVVSPSAVHAA
jgi:tRNA-specific 2-thiouridylase